MDNSFPYNHRINYNTFVTGVWIPYNGWRVKSLHDIKLKDGTILKQMSPNADAWSGQSGRIKDDEVIAIRVAPDEERGKYEYTGYSRIERDLRYFGHAVPVWLKDEERFIYPDEIPEGKYILPLSTALWKKCCTKEGDKEESWKIVTIVVTGQLSDIDLKSFADGELSRLYEETDDRLVLPEVLSERIRRYVLAKTGF